MMGKAERAMGLQAALLAKNVGIENLPAAIRARAAAFAPELIQNQAERAGRQTTEYKSAVQAGIFEPGELRNIREEIGKVDTKVRMDVQLDTESTAKQVLDGLQPVLRDLVKSIRAEMQSQAQEQREGQIRRNASQF
jgi:hypothetical protein